MQYLLSEEEYEKLVYAKGLAEINVRTEANTKLEEVKKAFIDSMQKALKLENNSFGTYSSRDYSHLLNPIADALKKLRL